MSADTPATERAYLLHDSKFDPETMRDGFDQLPLQAVPWSDRDSIPADARLLVYLGDEKIRELAKSPNTGKRPVGILPHPDAHHASNALGATGDLQALIRHYLAAEPIDADALTCNGELVISEVVIGKVLALRPLDIDKPYSRWSLLRGALKGLTALRLRPFKLVTAKEREIRLAALGMVAISHTQSRLMRRSFAETLSINDGRMSLLMLAPRSVIGYLVFLARLVVPGKLSLSRLPASLGLVQSNHLRLEAPGGIDYLLDGKPVHASEMDFEVVPKGLKLLPGPSMSLEGGEKTASDKETVKLNDLPVGDVVKPMMDWKTLPLFSHASEEEYRELFVALRASSLPSSSYQVLMVLSVMLALTGLYADSAPVIIGAMILAPLMSPVVSLAMGLARTEVGLIRTSIKTLLVGVAWGLVCAVLLAWAMPLDLPTEEMRSRMSPTLLDLLVAVISGIAGAYASAKSEIAKSLAGVAIAVALVPPLAVAGIGLGWGEWDMAAGALLLLLTNLVGIALAGSVTFLAIGFAPFERARRGLGITLGILLVIAIPLYISFTHLVEKDHLLSRIPRGEMELVGIPVQVGSVSIKAGTPWVVRVVLSSPERLDHTHVEEYKQIITDRTGMEVAVEAQFSIRR
jgi:uncharacterized hydrophobic protein (TIGR00271 family)